MCKINKTKLFHTHPDVKLAGIDNIILVVMIITIVVVLASSIRTNEKNT